MTHLAPIAILVLTAGACVASIAEGMVWAWTRYQLESFDAKLEREWRERKTVEVSDTIPW